MDQARKMFDLCQKVGINMAFELKEFKEDHNCKSNDDTIRALTKEEQAREKIERGRINRREGEGYMKNKKSRSIWHDFEKEKPSESGFYVCAFRSETGFLHVGQHLYFTESGCFNWRGDGEDTSFPVRYWAKAEDLVPGGLL